jgi:hypothetical protein
MRELRNVARSPEGPVVLQRRSGAASANTC